MRGEIIDMERLKMSNADQVALGNASKNARGDQLGAGGVIIRTQEQIEAEWNAMRARREAQAAPVDLKAEESVQRAVADLAPKPKKLTDDDIGFEPVPTAETPVQRRRVVDGD